VGLKRAIIQYFLVIRDQCANVSIAQIPQIFTELNSIQKCFELHIGLWNVQWLRFCFCIWGPKFKYTETLSHFKT